MIDLIASLGDAGRALLGRLERGLRRGTMVTSKTTIHEDVVVEGGAAGPAAPTSITERLPPRYHLPDRVRWGSVPGVKYTAFGTPYLRLPIKGGGGEPIIRTMTPNSSGWWIQPRAQPAAGDEVEVEADTLAVQPVQAPSPAASSTATSAGAIQRALGWWRGLLERLGAGGD